MSDIMLQGVLRMPYEMAMENEWSRRQFHDRAKQAADRIEELEGIVRDLVEQTGWVNLELAQIAPAILSGREPCTKEAEKMDAIIAKARAALGE